MTWLVAATVFAPLTAAIAAFIRPQLGSHFGLAASSIAAAAAFVVAMTLPSQGAQLLPLGGWDAPLGIQWRVDGLSVLMLALAGVIAILVNLYAAGFFAGESGGTPYFWALWMMMLAGLNALFLSDDLFNLYVTLEILGLSAVALVALAGGRPLG